MRHVPLPAETAPASFESFGFAELVLAKVRDLHAVAATKNVELGCDEGAFTGLKGTSKHDDRDAIERAVVTGLLSAVRFTPPGGAVRIVACKDDGELRLELRKSAVEKVLDGIGASARLLDRTGEVAILCLSLPGRKESER
jgi:hypothetical protein